MSPHEGRRATGAGRLLDRISPRAACGVPQGIVRRVKPSQRQNAVVASRDEILHAIRRTAADNGGKPLGRGRLTRLTGITEYALAQHWPNYSDAVREAGFEPNVLNAALDDAAVLGRFVALTRDLGHVPTSNDLRHARANDPSFPSRGVFDRLGSRNDRIARALEYCRINAVPRDVVAILEAAYDARGRSDERDSIRAGEPMSFGFVYLARGHPGEFKVGRTNLVDRRLVELGAMSATEPTLIHAIKTDDPAGIEAYWHRRFADKRMRGEWFRLTAADVAAFRRWRRIF